MLGRLAEHCIQTHHVPCIFLLQFPTELNFVNAIITKKYLEKPLQNLVFGHEIIDFGICVRQRPFQHLLVNEYKLYYLLLL